VAAIIAAMTLPPEPDTTAIQTDDPAELRRLLAAALNDRDQAILEREQVIQERNRVLETQNQHITALSQQVQQLEELVRLMRLRQFGVRSEATPPEQISLFNEAELMEKVDELLPEDKGEAVSEDPKTPPRKAGRRPLPASLPRVRIEHDLAKADKICPACGTQRLRIAEVISEEIDYLAARLQVLVHARQQYACPACEGEVITAPVPSTMIPKSNASAGLLAHVATSKYQDALPLYRQESQFERLGIDLGRGTLSRWMIICGERIQPLINLLNDQQKDYPVLHCDETRVQVLQEPGREARAQSFMWVRVGGPPTRPIRLFDYHPGRSGEVACQLLDGYQGYLHCDGYAGYDKAIEQNQLTRVGCWAHARRYFVEAQKANVKGKTGKADMAVNLIGKLYQIERRLKDASPSERYRVRQQDAMPQLDKIRTWLDQALPGSLPKTLLGKALVYLDNQWPSLIAYVEDGRLNIDNNPAENAIRPFVVGRKNWLFSASIAGAKASANLYSLIETAKANGLEPLAYLNTVFTRLPQADSLEAIERLLPWNQKQE
jgi:transposase